jgi:hypothetical protein
VSHSHSQSLWGLFRTLPGELFDRNRLLFVVTCFNVVLALCFTALMAVDSRTILGRNVWTKPWKFATSIAIFTATMAWILPSLSLTERRERLVTYIIGGAMTIEIVLISTQAARGVASHFNNSTPLDSTIFAVMGVTITISSIAVAYVLWRIVRTPPDLTRAYLRSIQVGMFVFVLASFQGWLMVSYDGHSVGVAAESAGLPLFNWKVTGGDLRIAHFIGLHALQVLPLTGYVVARSNRLSRTESLLAVGTVSVLYGGVTLATFVQALLGNPFVPEGVVPVVSPALLAALGLIGSICGTVALAVLLLPERKPTTA